MPTKTQMMPVDEYLNTTFEDGDCDYVDGEIVERYVGQVLHSFLQAALIRYFQSHRRSLVVLPEIRLQVAQSRFRVADIAVWPAGPLGPDVPKVLPFLAIEIVSPGESFVYMHEKVQDYLAAGISTVWVLDPWKQAAIEYTLQRPGGYVTTILRAGYSDVEISTVDLFASLPTE